MATDDQSARNRWSEQVRFVIYTGWALMILVTLSTIGAVVVLSLWRQPIDPNLADLAKISTGFLIGSFPAIMRDLLKEPEA